jgi:hypothetical protein
MNTPAPKSPTPILDLECPLPKANQWERLSWRQAFLIVILPLLAVFLLVPTFLMLSDRHPLAAKFFKSVGAMFDRVFKGSADQDPMLYFLFYFFSLMLILLIHELGHVAAGMAVGFQFKRIRIGPITMLKSSKGIKFTLQRISSLDGIAAMEIPHRRKLRRKLAIYIAAGPFANLLSGACVWLFLTGRFSDGLPRTFRQSLQFFSALSILIPLANLIPYLRHNGMFTDGARLVSLAGSRAKTRRWLCLIALHARIKAGTRLRDLNRTWISKASAISDKSLDAIQGPWIAYLVENDAENVEAAARYLEQCLERFRIASPEFQKMMLMEGAIFQAWFRDDEQKARVWSERFGSSKSMPLLNQLRLAICMHWAGRRYDEIASAWEQGRAHIESLPPSPANDSLKRGWHEWKNQIDTKRAGRQALVES